MGLCLAVGHVFNQINTQVAVEACALSFTWVRTLTEKAGSREPHRAHCLSQSWGIQKVFPCLGPLVSNTGQTHAAAFPSVGCYLNSSLSQAFCFFLS